MNPVVQQPLGMNKVHPFGPGQQDAMALMQLGMASPITPQYGMPSQTPNPMVMASLVNSQYNGQPITSPITNQYGMPQMTAMTPPGLAYLSSLDKIIIKQDIDLLELVTGFETNNRYKIMSPHGMLLYNAEEQSDTCARQCYGASRAFTLAVNDLAGQPLITVDRPFHCGCGDQEMTVFSPPGTLAGKVEQIGCFSPKFHITDAQGSVVFQIEGPTCPGGCSCSDVDFEVISATTNSGIGRISKQWTGLVQEMYTNADTFGISFPADLAVSMKAVLIGACFLIDFMYFEQPKNRNH